MKYDIYSITKYLDQYLVKNKKSYLDPVEGNAILDKAGLLKDSDARPGKPLRELLRKGLFPHARQIGGKGSSWQIPISSKNSLMPSIKNENQKLESKPTKSIEIITNMENESSKHIMSHFDLLSNFISASSIDTLVPDKPGLYMIRIKDISKLPNEFSESLKIRNHNIIYIGIATQSLKKRMLNQELRAKGHGTFFRSIGAVLGYTPPKGSLKNKANKRNYTFAVSDEQKIIQWINSNLMITWKAYSKDLEPIETELILHYKPLLNISKNPDALSLLSELRKKCVEIARS